MAKYYQPKQNSKSKIMNLIFGSIAIGLLIAAASLTFAGHPYTITVNSWQAKIMGDNEYFPVLTIFLLALPPLLALLLIKLIVLKLIKK